MDARERTWMAATIAIGMAGVGGIVGGPAIDGAAGEAVSSAGQALVASALIGTLVDARARRRFAEQVGKNVFLTIFGRKAPLRYVQELERFCRRDRIALSSEWELRFDWRDQAKEVVRVATTLLSEGKNISSTPVAGPLEVWEIPSVNGLHSSFERYELSVCADDGSALERLALDPETLKEHVAPGAGTDDVVLNLHPFERRLMIPAERRYRLRLELVTYRRANDLIPLLTRVPTIEQWVTLSGDALGDLDVLLFHEDSFLPHRDASTERRREYAIASVTFPGQATIVSWRRKARAPAPPAPEAAPG